MRHHHFDPEREVLSRIESKLDLIIERIILMDATVIALKTEIDNFIADATAQIEAAKTTAAAALAKAVADSEAGRTVDLKALQDEVAAAHVKITIPAFTPSNN